MLCHKVDGPMDSEEFIFIHKRSCLLWLYRDNYFADDWLFCHYEREYFSPTCIIVPNIIELLSGTYPESKAYPSLFIMRKAIFSNVRKLILPNVIQIKYENDLNMHIRFPKSE